MSNMIDFCQAFIYTRKFFCKNGHFNLNFNWIKVYFLLRRFTLFFKFFVNIKTKQIQVKYIPKEKQFENKFHFLRLFIKLNKSFKWTHLNFNDIFNSMHVIRKNSLKIVIANL